MLNLEKQLLERQEATIEVLQQLFDKNQWPVKTKEFKFYIKGSHDLLAIWVDQEDGLQTSKKAIEIGYTKWIDGDWDLNGLIGGFEEKWLPLINELKAKKKKG